MLVVQRVDCCDGWGQSLELIATPIVMSRQSFEVIVHESKSHTLSVGFVAADCAKAVQSATFVGVCAGARGGAYIDATKPLEMKKKRGPAPVTMVRFPADIPTPNSGENNDTEPIPLSTTVVIRTHANDIVLCATNDGEQVRAGTARLDWGHVRFEKTEGGHYLILSLRNKKLLRTSPTGTVTFSGNTCAQTAQDEWRVDVKGAKIFLVSNASTAVLQRSADGSLKCHGTSRQEREAVTIVPVKSTHMGSLACEAGDKLGCVVTYTEGNSDGCISFTLNGEVQGKISTVHLGNLSENHLCPFVLVDGNASFSFVAADTFQRPTNATLSASEKALVELDICASIARAITNGDPPPRVVFVSPDCQSEVQSSDTNEPPKPLRHPAHPHVISEREGSFSYYCDVCGSSPGPDFARYRCSTGCDWDVCEQCAKPFLPAGGSFVRYGDEVWLTSAADAWRATSATEFDMIAVPSRNWNFSCDEALCRVLSDLKPDDPLSSVLLGLARYPILQSERIGIILRRARLMLRYSALVMRVMPLVCSCCVHGCTLLLAGPCNDHPLPFWRGCF
jgi:hypothetical protein